MVRGDSAFAGADVVLHRVSVNTAGEIDTVTAGPRGDFAFRLPTVPDPGGRGEVYFASVRHQDILYFGRAIHQAADLDSLYTIEVHDTAMVASGGVELPISVRYLIFDPVESGWQVTDLFHLVNEGDYTLVARENDVVWAYPLPAGARDFQVGSGDISPDAAILSAGVFRVSAPLPPGSRQFIVRYVVDELDTTIPLPGRIATVELLIREPAPSVEVSLLTAVEAAELEPGVTYRRFVGDGIQNAVVTLQSAGGGGGLPVRWLAVGMAMVLAVVAVWVFFLRGGPTPASAAGSAPPGPAVSAPQPADRRDARDALIVEVARIDEALESDSVDPEEADDLQRRRAVLLRRIQALS